MSHDYKTSEGHLGLTRLMFERYRDPIYRQSLLSTPKRFRLAKFRF